MSEKHNVYLAVPGPRVCWGTTIGVVNSTTNNIAYPHNMGMGFSGVEDFNMLWTDAINQYERGIITHFAMLHGDITPDPEQRWLDELLAVMDKRGASLVSAVSPIKDHRGLTSTGIADLSDPWRPYRRFTLREIHEELPESFDHVEAGYPDRPLLHNTGLWVCDLRRDVFRRENDRGELDMYFRFPTRSVRDNDKSWMHQRESEDWLFSRDLWNRGIRDTVVTRRVRLTHHGKMDFSNSRPWGSFQDGDENTADKWRAARDKLPLSLLQMLQFEIGAGCNLAAEHKACPSGDPRRFAGRDTSRTVDDDTIVASAVRAYRDLGFTGMIGWAYYNEPLLYAERMFKLMERISAATPRAKFILWTNGTMIPEDVSAYRQFKQIVVSAYNAESRRGAARLLAAGITPKTIETPTLDDRLEPVVLDGIPHDTAPCLRPFVELAIDAHGEAHLCCYDWQGRASVGNLLDEDFDVLAARWRETIASIAGQSMTADAPAACRLCGRRWSQYQCHDNAIVERARRWRAAQPQAAEVPV